MDEEIVTALDHEFSLRPENPPGSDRRERPKRPGPELYTVSYARPKVSYHGKAEWFGVYSPDTEKVYMVAVSESGKGSEMKLRLHPTKNNQEKNVNWARDYEI